MTRPLSLAAALLAATALPAAALECGADQDPFDCLQTHAQAELSRLDLTPNEDQRKSFEALIAFDIYLDEGPEAAVAAWEAAGHPVYDLLLTLLLADQKEDAKKVALAATKSFGATDANGKDVTGEAGYEQMVKDLRSYYHGEEDMVYSRACVSDQAFKEEVGGGPKMRDGACRAPYNRRSIQRAFGTMQLMRDVSAADAVEAALQYAYRVPSCTVATAIIEVVTSPSTFGDGEDYEETATWKVLDMATICAAELLVGHDL